MKMNSQCHRSRRRESAHSDKGLSGLTSAATTNERGIALVTTLILLSVTLIMAVAFLAVTRRERNAATTTTDTATARLATEAALAAAETEIVANLLTSPSNSYNLGLLVSTNYLPTPIYDPFNVGFYLPRAPVFVQSNNGGYDFRFYLDANRNGKFDANGWVGNVDGSGATNGTIFEVGDPEWIGVLERPDAIPANNNKFLARYAFLAQPVGNGLDLNYIHNQTASGRLNPTMPVASDGYFRNQGVGSWELNLAAFLADLNTNQWDPPAAFYVYNRPLGLANSGNAFQDALSLLSYRYNYNYNTLGTASGYLVNSAISYPFNVDGYSDGSLQTTVDFNPTPLDNLNNPWAGANNTNRFFSLPSDLFDTTKVGAVFPVRLASASAGTSTYDSYTFYNLLSQLGTDSTADDGRMDLNYRNVTNGVVAPGMETNLYPWTALEFFTNAANRLLTNSTANWLAANPQAYVSTFGISNAFGLGGIPVYIYGTNAYTPTVNRLLQLAANMYDASTNSPWPSVFRPMFTVVNQNGFNNVYINGYQQVVSVIGTNDAQLATPTNVTALAVGTYNNQNVYGVPWIIGAKKGLPNFNQFSMLTAVQVTRKLQVTKPSMTAPLSQFQTNQMYEFSITNLVGCSLWNSYTSAYTGTISIVARDSYTALLINDAPGFTFPLIPIPPIINLPLVSQINTNSWSGTLWADVDPTKLNLDYSSNSFIVPFNFTNVFLPEAIYRYAGYNAAHPNPWFDESDVGYQTTATATTASEGLTPQLPNFGLMITNRLQVFILNRDVNNICHVIDYVHYDGPGTYININTNLADPDSPDYKTDPGNAKPIYWMWSTNGVNGGPTPYGVIDQINASLPPPQGLGLPPGEKWITLPNLPAGLPSPTETLEKDFFYGFFDTTPGHPGLFPYPYPAQAGVPTKLYTNNLLAVQVPYTPTKIIYSYFSWEANDPLVHYLASDLDYTNSPVLGHLASENTINFSPWLSFTNVTTPYSPWGQDYFAFSAAQNNGKNEKYVPANIANWLTAIKDSLVWRSDNWDFPTNKYPTVGWLGRVHRGTPWQTVYLKSYNILDTADGPASWVKWAGDTNGFGFDATNSAPVADEALFDLFTTALDANATHGTLSVNQTGLAAWSAVFSGIVALTNATASPSATTVPVINNVIIPPAGAGGANSALNTLVNSNLVNSNLVNGVMVYGINPLRANFTNTDGLAGAFEHVGSILRAPALTEQSRFLHWADAGTPNTAQQQFGISDELYEWLPQQMMGLVRVTTTPRYVIYCYGQALRPAVNGVVTSSANFGMITNYQIVAESAARAVIHVNKNVLTNALGVVTGTNYTTVVESYNLLPPQ